MQPVPITCPNCGGGLGPLREGQYLCAYCGHRSSPPQPVLDQARQDELVAQAVARHEAARSARARAAAEAASQRERDELVAKQGSDGIVMRGTGVLFLAFALACFGGALLASQPSDAWVSLGMGFFWLVLGGGLFRAGVRARRAVRLRAQGLRGRAIIASYRETKYLGGFITVDGRYHMVLRVELAGRPSYTVKVTDYAPGVTVTTEAELPVFVDAANPNAVTVDWITAAGM
jgi:hypothetical protein